MFLRRREIDQAFELQSGSFNYSIANVGDIVLNDLSIIPLSTYNQSQYLPAIGVVFENNSNELKIVSKVQSDPIAFWLDLIGIAALTNISSSAVAVMDKNGKSNTDKIISQLGANSSYAAGFCYNFTLESVGDSSWYLPSLGELNTILTNKTTLNESLAAMSGALIKEIENLGAGEVNSTSYDLILKYHAYWTSTEYNTVSMWIGDLEPDLYLGVYPKTTSAAEGEEGSSYIYAFLYAMPCYQIQY